MASTIEASAQAMSDKFGCDKACVAKALNSFYKDLCPDGTELKNRNGKVIEKDGDTGGEGEL